MSLLDTATDNGIQPIVSVPGEGVFTDRLRELGHEILLQPYAEKLNRYGGAIYRDGLATKLATVLDGIKYILTCRRQLKQRRPQSVFCNDMRGLLTVGVAARSLGIPVMTWDKLDKPHGILDWFQLPLVNLNAIISTPVTNKYPPWQRWWYRNKIHLIPNGADLPKFENVIPMRRELGISDDALVVAIVGTVTPRKAQDRLLGLLPEIADQIPNLVILIVGSWKDSPGDESYYRDLPNRDHPCVRFLGQQIRMPEIMASIDVLAIPSRHEGMGQVTVEAMASGKPVIGSDAGGIPEVVIDQQTGLIFHGNDADGFFQGIKTLASDANFRQTLGRSGLQRAKEHYNRPIQMQKIVALLKSLTG